ncbi:MAG: zinc carboxypeptidase [Saprospiraceae bacterium]|nr:zinc carboxypeptidase [Saprospiraceae bacterium]
MRKGLLFTFLSLTICLFGQKKPLSYYLPETVTYDKNIPTPEQFLGYQVGEQHVSHDQLVAYMRELDRLSDRITLEVVGRSYEYRPMMILTITSPENHRNVDKIKAEHAQLLDPSVSNNLDVSRMPIIVYQGHSIHGNEASGANAGLLAAYHWAAAQGKEVEETLQNVVILFDPSFNPDGLQRFSQWVNMHKGKNLVNDPSNREFSEVFPYGRTNHYWFDLNRDWLVQQQPESQGRVRIFHDWKPNILTDHHEQGSNATFFFQPGVPSRTNPYTPMKNQEMTGKIAAFHAKALDKIGSQYFTKENYDDFYYGKGSTYPDVQGCIGILFEQASSRGHAQRTSNGVLTFPFTIRNQLTTSFSTIEAAQALRIDLLNYQRDFYKSAKEDAAKDKVKAYVFGEKSDVTRLNRFVEMLQRNKIKVYELGQNYQNFEKGSAYVVPLEQMQYRLIKANFERYTEGFFKDSLFYDISTWTLPLAFNINLSTIDNTLPAGILGKEVTQGFAPVGDIAGNQKSAVGYVFEWTDYLAPQLLTALMNENLQAKVLTNASKVTTTEGDKKLSVGSIFIPVQNQLKSSDAIFDAIQNAAKKTNVKVYALKTGLATEGADLGSPSIVALKKPNVALLVGEGVTNNDAGEFWHLLDTRYDMQVTLLDITSTRWKLDAYTCVIMPDGTYSAAVAGRVKDYLANGGTVAAFGKAVKFLKTYDMCHVDFKSIKATPAAKNSRRPYNAVDEDEGKEQIRGAIFETETDLTHPLLYGYSQPKLPIFREERDFFEIPTNAYAAPLVYTSNPLLSGYLSAKNKELAKNAAAVVVSSVGTGRVIAMIDNPNFRAFWYGTNKLTANMVFFGSLINARTLEVAKAKD